MDATFACTLTPADQRERAEALAALAAGALRAREPTAGGERLRFAACAGTEDALRAVMAAEARCCPFLRMELGRDGDDLVLGVSGPPAARPVIAALFAAAGG